MASIGLDKLALPHRRFQKHLERGRLSNSRLSGLWHSSGAWVCEQPRDYAHTQQLRKLVTLGHPVQGISSRHRDWKLEIRTGFQLHVCCSLWQLSNLVHITEALCKHPFPHLWNGNDSIFRKIKGDNIGKVVTIKNCQYCNSLILILIPLTCPIFEIVSMERNIRWPTNSTREVRPQIKCQAG